MFSSFFVLRGRNRRLPFASGCKMNCSKRQNKTEKFNFFGLCLGHFHRRYHLHEEVRMASNMTYQMTNDKIPTLETLDENELPTFTVPMKKINEGHDVTAFLMSRAYSDIMTFVLQLNYAMFPRYTPSTTAALSNTQTWELDNTIIDFSNTVNRLRNLLADIENIINETPPDPGPRRFGNISFRKWAESVENQSKVLLERHLPAGTFRVRSTSEMGPHEELASYLLGSFGSSQRLDYGTGHELSFLAFLGGIWKLGGFGESKSPGDEERGIVIGVIEPYVGRDHDS